jgi:site-specific DNA recombinase
MRAAVYARVSTTRQAQAQTIEQQLDRLRAEVAGRGWELGEQHVYRDDGFSGARLGRPGLDRLRDHAALAEVDVVLVTAPDRLARNYVHQVLLIEELAGHGCRVEFLDRPMSTDPHDQLLLQIRGAVAEYERTLITERMRRGRHARLRAGTLLPWTTPPFGYRLDPDRPRDPAGVRTEPGEAALITELFDWYLEPRATLYQLARRLTDLGVTTPMGRPRWNVASVRGILRNPAYAGQALSNRTQVVPARRRKSAMLPAGPGQSHAPRPEQEWIAVPVPPIVSAETFAQVQAKLDANQQGAARNTRHEYLLRALVSCGACRLGCTGRQTGAGYRYYLCRGRTDPLRAAEGHRCTARYIPAGQLDELVWADLRALLADPAQATRALSRAQGGAWLPQELQARQATVRQALDQLDRQQQRLLDAYLAEVVTLPELDRKRQDLDRRRATLLAQQRQLDAAARQKLELGAVADGIEEFCQTVRAGLATATFEQRRMLAELLIDRVIVTDSDVEIRYVLPVSPDGPHRPFCQLRKDHLDGPPAGVPGGQRRGRAGAVIQQRGDQPVSLGPGALVIGGHGEPELDDPDGDPGQGPRLGRQRAAAAAARGVAAGPPDHLGRVVDVREPGPVRQRPDREQVHRGRDPPQQVRPGPGSGGPQAVAVEVPVGQQQHPRAQAAQQVPGQRLLSGALAVQRARCRPQQPPGAAGDQRHQPHLRVVAVLPAPGPAESGDVRLAGRHLDSGPVPGRRHQPADQRSRCRLRPQRPRQPPEQQLERPLAEPAPDPGQRRRRRDLPPRRLQRPAQPGRQLPQHLLIRQAGEQAQPQHEIHAQPPRQRPEPLPGSTLPGLCQHLIHQARRDPPGQHPDLDPGQDPAQRRRPPAAHDNMDTQRSSS